MPFGLTDAPFTFQNLMNHVLKPYLHKFILGFIDDIFVFSKDVDTHRNHLHITLDIDKCQILHIWAPLTCIC